MLQMLFLPYSNSRLEKKFSRPDLRQIFGYFAQNVRKFGINRDAKTFFLIGYLNKVEITFGAYSESFSQKY